MVKARILVLLLVTGVVAASCSSSDADETTTTSTTVAVTTTTEAASTTTAAPTTTTTAAPETTTTTAASAGYEVAETPVFAELQPYSAGGAELFPAGSVQAHWYQWDGLYVVLYRGFDASDGAPICAGNSAQEAAGFNYISDSPHNGTVDEICDGVPKVAEPPSGVSSCGPLLYMVTEIPTDVVANLWGTLEIVKGGGADGQTSAAQGNIGVTPEFEPGLDAYVLPATTVDDGGPITCG
jgi:hypothetical protein